MISERRFRKCKIYTNIREENMKVKGVNLGNWLVLEKWMSPSLFDGTTAEDEYYLPTQLSKEVYEARIKIHRSEYITERDFTRIKSMGMDAVRIPVPYFIFGEVSFCNVLTTAPIASDIINSV